MRRFAPLIALLVTVGALAAALRTGRSEPGARARSSALLEAAERAAMEGAGESEWHLLLEAARVDPTYLPALLAITRHPAVAFRWIGAEPLVDGVLRTIPDAELRDCMRKVALAAREEYVLSGATPRGQAALECDQFYRSLIFSAPISYATRGDDMLRLWRKYPQSLVIAEQVGHTLYLANDLARKRAIAQEMLHSGSLLVRAHGYVLLRAAAAAENDLDAVARYDAAVAALARRRPCLLQYYDLTSGRLRQVSLDSLLRVPGDRFSRLLPLTDKATSAYTDGDLVDSERLWTMILREYSDFEASAANARMHIGRTHLKSGQLAAAETNLLVSLQMATAIQSPSLVIQAHHNLFHVYEGMGDTARAQASGNAYVESSMPRFFASQRMMAHHDVGWYHWRLGHYGKASTHLDHMLALIDSMGEQHHYAGEYYERIGQLDRALEKYDRAATDVTNNRSVARRAVIAAQMGDRDRAIQLATQHDTTPWRAYPEFTPQLPGILARFGMYEDAALAAVRAESRARARRQGAAVANLLLERAQLELKLGHARLAYMLGDSAVGYALKVSEFETAMLGRAARALAGISLTNSNADLDSLGVLAEHARQAALATLQLQLRTMLAQAHAVRGEKARALTEYAGAARLNDAIAASLPNDADRARFRSAGNDVSNRALAIALTLPDHGPAAVAEWSIRRKGNGISGKRGSTRASWRPQAGEAIVDYLVLDSAVAAYVRTATGHAVRVLPISPAQLRADVRALQDGLTPRLGAMLDRERSQFDAARAHRLYRALIEPLQTDLAGAQRLVIIGDGPLHYLAFDALVYALASKPRYLFERYEIRNAISLALANDAPRARQGFVRAFTGAAPVADAEVAAIARQSSAQLQIVPLPLSASTERHVRDVVRSAAVLHFATHAATNDAAPLFAHLALHPDNSDDGRLHGFEIEQLDLGGQLVVLSGCDTGRGYLAGGEGVLSLSRAFLRAGASASVATLWPVGEGTPAFMAAFYRELAAGRPPAAALRAARLEALNGPFAHPLYWAPFVIISA
jgi:CHAT domain-containing protein